MSRDNDISSLIERIGRLEDMVGRGGAIMSKFESLDNYIALINTNNTAMGDKVNQIENRIDNLNLNMVTMSEQIKNMTDNVAAMKRTKDECSNNVKEYMEKVHNGLYGNGTPEKGLINRVMILESLTRLTIKIGIALISILVLALGLKEFLPFIKF